MTLRYRYDVLAAIQSGVSEYAEPEGVIRQAAPSATDIKSLGKYLRTFWSPPLAEKPAYITECTTKPDLKPGICEACNGDRNGTIDGEVTRCTACEGTGNAPVEPARDGEPRCEGQNECGGSCIRAAGHTGKHLCVGDEGNIPETCPA